MTQDAEHLSPESLFAALGAEGPAHSDTAPEGPAIQQWVAPLLDQIDYGLVVVGPGLRVLHANASAHDALQRGGHALALHEGRLSAGTSVDSLALANAVDAALARQMRRLLTVGANTPRRSSVAVVPVRLPRQSAALLVLERRSVCSDLSIQCFGHAHDLTLAESRVLALVCEGCSPQQIACIQGVALSTVRTQLANVRAKTGASSLRDLVHCVASLPPLVPVQPVRSAVA